MISWNDVVKVASKLMLNTETGTLLRQTVKNNFTQTKNQWGCYYTGTYMYTNAAHALIFRLSIAL